MTEKTWTEEQIYNAARKEWMGILLQLWEAFGKEPDTKQVQVYVNQLGEVHLGLLEGAVSYLLANHKYNSVPTIAELMKAIDKITHDDWRVSKHCYIHRYPNGEAANRSRKKIYSIEGYKKSWLGKNINDSCAKDSQD